MSATEFPLPPNPLQQRNASKTASPDDHDRSQQPDPAERSHPSGRESQGFRTLSYEESLREVPWQTDNKYIRSGYRRLLSRWKDVFWSVIGYWHNETVNIHSHLWGAMIYLILIPLHISSSPGDRPSPHPYAISAHAVHQSDLTPKPQTMADKIAITTFLLSAVTCLGLSGWFHVVQCSSKERCDRAHTGDYVGIVVLIVGSFYSCLYYGFQDQPIWRAIYLTSISLLGLLAAYTVLAPGRRTSAQIWHRTLTFVALGLSGVIPVCHVMVVKGIEVARSQMGVDWMAGSGICYIFGAVLYAARIPEKLSPGTFDLIGSSHQIFHLCVLGGSWCTYQGIRRMALHEA